MGFQNPGIAQCVAVVEHFIKVFLAEPLFIRDCTHVLLHIRRTGTDAADMPDQIPNAVKTERAAKMAERAEAVRQKFLEAQVGFTESVLIESEIKDGMMQGYTMNYTPVVIPAVKSLLCTVQEVVITGVSGDVCTGRIKNPPVGYDPMGMFE